MWNITFTTWRCVLPTCPKKCLNCKKFSVLQGNFILSRRPHLTRRIPFSFRGVITLGRAEKISHADNRVPFTQTKLCCYMKGFTSETTLVFNGTVILNQEQTHLSFHDRVCTCKGCNTGDPISGTQRPFPPPPNQSCWLFGLKLAATVPLYDTVHVYFPLVSRK